MTAAPAELESACQQRSPARIGILSQGTSQFDSRAQRIARSCAAAGDTVTIYSRYRPGLPQVELMDGYRIVRLPLSASDERRIQTDADEAAGNATDTAEQPLSRDPLSRIIRTIRWTRRRIGKRARIVSREAWDGTDRLLDRVPAVRRFRQFPWYPMRRAAWFERQVEPQDIWHGMWAGSLPALSRVRRRHGGASVYDARDVFLRARLRATMPEWERRILTRFERRWALEADVVIQVSEPYAAMTQRDLGLAEMPVVRNCPERWDPPEPRPDRFRQLLGIGPETAIVLYQGLLMSDRGIEQAMDAILQVRDAVLILMGFGDQNGRGKTREDYQARAQRSPWKGRVHVIDAVAPTELLYWSASSDIMVMAYPDNSENHRYTTPQKLWEAMAAGVPVVASDLPGMAPIVSGVDCGVLCDPASPASIAAGIQQLLDEGPVARRARGERGRAAAHETYNWEAQFQVLDAVYARLLDKR
jgi:glycosyltransferase involved in cell wall biosynthesis